MAETSNVQNIELWLDVNRKLDKKRLENSLALSLPKFMEAYGGNMSKKDLEAFLVAVNDILSSILSGNVGERTIARELVFKDGKERGTENKRMKLAYGLAANFVNSVIDAMPEYVAPVVLKPIEEKKEIPTTKEVTKVETTPKKEELLDPLSIIQQKLNKKRDSKLLKLANWNVEASPILMLLPNINYNEDSVFGMYKKMNLGNGYASYFRNKLSPEFFANLNSILSPEKLGNNDIQITNSFGKRMSAKQHIVNTLDFFIKHPELVPNNGEFNRLSNGKITIPGSFNEDTGTILLYNPNNRTISRESITNEPELFQHYQYELGLILPQLQEDNIVPINKNGGILKFAYGGTAIGTDYMSDELLNNYINSYQTFYDKMQLAKLEKALNVKLQKLQAIKNAADAKDRSVKTQEKMTTPISKKDLSGADITRIISAIGDLGSVAASFVPGAGTMVGAGIGAASTLANLGADLADGDNVWDSLERAGVNLGLDAVSLIPGAGATGKLAKIGKNLTKAAPWVLGAMAASNLGEEAKAFKKLITNPSDLNADDINMIAGGLSLVLGLRTGYKARKIRNEALVKNKKGLVTDSGKVAIMDAEELKNLKTNEQLNAKLKSMKGFENETVSGAFKNESKGYKNLWGYTLNIPKTIDIYNFKNNKGLDARVLERRAHGYLPIRGDKYKYNVNSTPSSSIPKVTETYSPTYNMGFDPVLGHNVVYRKGGGVIKALQGTKLWLSNLIDYDPAKYVAEYGNTLYGINENNLYTDGFSYGNNGLGKVNSRYKTDTRFSDYSSKGQNYAKSIEALKYYNDFSNALYNSYNEYISNPTRFGNDKNLFYRWAKKYDSALPTESTSRFFDSKGNLNTNWAVKNYDAYGRDTKQTYTNGLEYLKHLRYDNLLANAHNDFIKEGNRFFYKDSEGKEHWVSPEDAKKYTVSKNPIKSSIDGVTKWNDYELTGPATNHYKLGEGQLPLEKTSVIDSISNFNKSPEGLLLKSDLSELARAYYIKLLNLKRLKAINNFLPYHLEHPTFERQTTDMTNILKSAYDNGALAMAKNNIPRYADASLNEAIKRETAADVRQNIMLAEKQNAEYINQLRDANDKLAMQNEQTRIETANKNKQLDYAANEEKRINTMKINAANTDIDNAVWMKHSYDLMQNAEKQSSLQDWWKQLQLGSLADEELRLLNSNDKYKLNRAKIIELIGLGKDPNGPEISKIVLEQEDLVNQIKMLANDSFLSRILQIYGINTTPIKRRVIYLPLIALNKSGGNVTIKTDSIEKSKLNARSKDNDRFMKSVSKMVDSFLSLDKLLGKSLLHKLTLINK